MLFTEHHIEQILDGTKNETRRRWDDKQVKVGNSYRASTSLFTPREDSPAYIVVDNVYKEPLGDMTEDAAQAEGGYTLSEFKELWEEMHGSWDSTEAVWVVEFTGYEIDPRKDS